MAETKGKLTLTFWGIQGRAQTMRWLLAYHKIDWENKQYSFQDKAEWFEVDKPTLSTDFPNLPYIKDGDLVITERPAVLQYAALKTGNKDLLGKSTLDTIKISQLYSFVNDLFIVIRDLAMDKDWEKMEILDEKAGPFLSKLSMNLGEQEYPLGYLTWVDFFVFTNLDLLRRMNAEFLAKWSNLEKYWERINKGEIEEYRKLEKCPKVFGPPGFQG